MSQDAVPVELTVGQTVGDLILAELPASTRLALQRCSLAGVFSEACYDAVLRGPDGPPLPVLLEEHHVSSPAGDTGYRLAPSLRKAAWSRWWSQDQAAAGETAVPAALAEFGRVYGTWCAANDDPIEAVRGFVLGDQPEAAEVLRRAYETAEAAMDLARARDLLLPLTDDPILTPLIQPELARVRNDLVRRWQIRLMWRNAYATGARYLHRPVVESTLVELLEPGGHRALRLAAAGGMGKSTTLAWFIAHHCVPAGIPCALIDLDWVDPGTLWRHPWLMLLEIAAQLDVQMPGSPFLELLREYGAYRGADTGAGGAAGVDILSGPTAAADGAKIESRVHDILAEGPGDIPVLIVVDTIEEAILRAAGAQGELLACLADLTIAVPQARVIVSGRHTRAEKDLTAYFARFAPAGTRLLDIPLFTADEATAYLTQVRGITDPLIVAAIVGRAERQPWQLALCADCVIVNPGISPAEVAQLDPALAWCIDRVVGRIPEDSLQWLIRYAVVVRRLRRDVAEVVLLRHVADAMRGDSDDDPDEDGRTPGSTPVFQRGGQPPEGRDGFNQLWERLLAYTATSSWVSMRSTDLVVLHPSVVEPLRRLLARRPIAQRLHADLAAHYDSLAQTPGPNRTEWRREAIYHRFQLDGPGAVAAWRATLEQAHREENVGAVRAIAEEVLGPDYLDDDRRPREIVPGCRIVDDQVLAVAHLELAWGLAAEARDEDLPGGHRVWGQVESSLSEVQSRWVELLDAEHARHLGVRGRFALGALQLARGRADLTVGTIRVPAVDAPGVDTELGRALLVCGEALDGLGRRDESIEVLTQARELAQERGDVATAARTARALSVTAEHEGRYDVAIRWARSAGDADRSTSTAGWMLAAGQPSEAADRGSGGIIGAIALATLGRLLASVRAFDRVLATERVARPETAIPTARARAELLDLDRALGGLLQARDACLSRQDLDGAVACSAEAVRIHLRCAGNVDQAEQYLDEGMRIVATTGSQAWASISLAAAEVALATGQHDLAVRQCEEVLAVLGTAGVPRAQVLSAAVSALALTSDDRFLPTVSAHLAAVSPDTARLAAVADLTLMPSGGPPIELPIGPLTGVDDDPDVAWAQLRMAEVHRVAGRTDEAADALTRGTRVLARDDVTVWWWWLRGMDRIGPARPEEPLPPELPADLPPLLLAAHEVTLALRRLRLDGAATARRREQRTRAFLGKVVRVTMWDARLHELAAGLAEAANDTEAARRCRDSAAATRRMLGADRRTDGAEPGGSGTGPDADVDLSVTIEGDIVRIAGADRSLASTDARLGTAMAEMNATGSTSALVKYLVAGLRGSAVLTTLPDVDSLMSAPLADPVDVCLTVDAPRLAQLPWELLPTGMTALAANPRVASVYRMSPRKRVGRVQVGALQRALLRTGAPPMPVDGLDGRLTQAATRAFQQSAGIAVDGIAGPQTWTALRLRLARAPLGRRPHVVILAPERGSEVHAKRGHGASGRDLASLYRQAGWEWTALSGVDPIDLPDYLSAYTPFDVLHISATMDATSTLPHLSLGGGPNDEGPANEGLPVTLLNRLLFQLSESGVVPLVVLDVTTPPRESELIRQLLARNDFAEQLVGLGVVETVLAAGLADPDGAVSLVELLTSGGPAAQLAVALHRRHHRIDPPSRPPPALFSALRRYMMGSLPTV